MPKKNQCAHNLNALRKVIFWLGLITCTTVPSVSFCAAFDGNTSALPPRLFAATRGSETAFFLAITHPGFAAEYDEYADEVVRYALRRSSKIYSEGALIGEDMQWFNRKCDDEAAWPQPLRDRAVARLSSYIDSTGSKLTKNPKLWSQPALFVSVVLYGSDVTDRKVKKSTVDTSLINGVAVHKQLASLYNVGIESIEDPADWVAAYCSVSPAERTQALEDYVAESGEAAKVGRGDAELVGGAFEALDSKLPDSSRELLMMMHSPSSKILLASRNAQWAAKIDRLMPKAVSSPLFALGVAHFLRAQDRPSILDFLRAKGFAVTRINSMKQLVNYFDDREVNRAPAANPSQVAPQISSAFAIAASATCTSMGGVTTVCIGQTEKNNSLFWNDTKDRFAITLCPEPFVDRWGRNHCFRYDVKKTTAATK
jgi:uncharacterized protein YbaP (TraB family)